jgi:diadenosine tetraphosphate (Ap4A) HIT family hydrolase
MLYEKYLKTLKTCPFCELEKNEIIKQNKFAILTLAKAPYTKDHLLVLPKKHILKLNSLTSKEKQALERLEYYALKKLHKKYKNVSILYREGNKKEVGKSIDHLHIHLIPNMQIGSRDINWRKRKVYSEKEYVKRIKEINKGL